MSGTALREHVVAALESRVLVDGTAKTPGRFYKAGPKDGVWHCMLPRCKIEKSSLDLLVKHLNADTHNVFELLDNATNSEALDWSSEIVISEYKLKPPYRTLPIPVNVKFGPEAKTFIDEPSSDRNTDLIESGDRATGKPHLTLPLPAADTGGKILTSRKRKKTDGDGPIAEAAQPSEPHSIALTQKTSAQVRDAPASAKARRRKLLFEGPRTGNKWKARVLSVWPNVDHLSVIDEKITEANFAFNWLRPTEDDVVVIPFSECSSYIPKSVGVEVSLREYGVAESHSSFSFERFEVKDISGRRLHFANADIGVIEDRSRERFILNTGGSIWGLDWCPGIEQGCQYIAVSGYKGTTEEHRILGVRQQADDSNPDDMKGCIQIWNAGPCLARRGEANEAGIEPRLDMIILHDGGCVYDLSWSPWGESEESLQPKLSASEFRRLGVLAVSFGDGSMRVFNVPHPLDVKKKAGLRATEIVAVNLRAPLLNVSLPDVLLWKLSWGLYDQIATGCTNGAIAVWSVGGPLRGDIQPSECYAHNAAVRDIDWAHGHFFQSNKNSSTSHCILTCGNDGRLLAHDIRDPWSSMQLSRSRALLTTASWVTSVGGVAYVEPDNTLRFFNPGEGRLKEDMQKGQATAQKTQTTVYLAAHLSYIWCVDGSLYIPFCVTASADGTVKLSNVNRPFTRNHKPTHGVLYRLESLHTPGTVQMVDGFPDELLTEISSKDTKVFPNEIAVQKVSFNKNRSCCSWVASGGSMGILRIENTLTNVGKSVAARSIDGKWDIDQIESTGNEGNESTSDVVQRSSSHVIMMKPNLFGNLFVALSADTVSLWSIRPQVMISRVSRSALTIEEDGENADVIWKPDSTCLAVVTNKGFIHFYDIVADGSKGFDFQFFNPHHFVSGPGERLGVPSVSLHFKMALEIDTGIRCGLGLHEELLLCTRESPSILSLTWSGVVNSEGTLSVTELDFHDDPNEGIVKIVTNAEMDLFAWIISNGKAFVTQRIAPDSENFSENEYEENSQSSFSWVGLNFYGDEGPATAISINTRFLLIAVGNDVGQVYIYSLSDDRSELRFCHRLILDSISDMVTRFGPVSTLEWSLDGTSITVGWESGGIAVWSVFGRLVMNCVTEESNQISNLFKDGVLCMFWGSFELLILSKAAGNTEIHILPFMQSSLIRCFTMDNVQKVVLSSDDRILLYEGNSADFDQMNFDVMQWESVQIPIMYISGNWPIRFTSVNSTGQYIAIAGRRGLAHYSTLTNSGGISWCGDVIIVATEDATTLEHELKFFSREANLDTRCLYSESMPDAIVAMTNLGPHILLFTADNVLRYFSITSTRQQKIALELHQQILLDGIVSNPFSVQSLAWNPPAPQDFDEILSVETLKKSPVIILKSGELSELKELPDGGWEHIGLSDKIEYFWISPNGGVLNSLWAFDGSGLKLWVDLESRPVEGRADDFVRINFDFYPLSINLEKGVIFGVEQRVSLRNSLQTPIYKIEPKTQLFIHEIIKYFLEKKDEGSALEFALIFQHLDYFNHSLEILVHQVLDAESESYLGFSEGAVLPSVIKFLEHFPSYLDVVVQCARKTEVSIWEYFFSIVGDPKDLFKKCLDQGSLTTATSYLIIIQTLEPISVSGKLAVELLERAFELEDFETGKELVRFFSSIEGKDGQNLNEMLQTTISKFEVNIDIEAPRYDKGINGIGETMYHLEVAISNHARKLLSEQRIRVLGQFSILLAFPLSKWLRRERNRSAIIHDWPSALNAVLDQFAWSMPVEYRETAPDLAAISQRRLTYSFEYNQYKDLLPVPPNGLQVVTAAKSGSRGDGPRSAPADTYERNSFEEEESLFGPSVTKADLNELRFLIECTRDAACWSWNVILNTLLMDVDAIENALKEDVQIRDKWENMLRGTGSSGYVELIAVVFKKIDGQM